ncbi:hypothetical protein MKEN_00847300 [Mycena kentingensis (nom. inval.)]|nr:hypothetical protein MKEN_00847300 [Mycena kentingensis (nom. inval.)]
MEEAAGARSETQRGRQRRKSDSETYRHLHNAKRKREQAFIAKHGQEAFDGRQRRREQRTAIIDADEELAALAGGMGCQ